LKFVYLREKNQRREDNDNEILEVIKFDHFSINNFLFLLSIHRVFLFELPHPTKERLAEKESDSTIHPQPTKYSDRQPQIVLHPKRKLMPTRENLP